MFRRLAGAGLASLGAFAAIPVALAAQEKDLGGKYTLKPIYDEPRPEDAPLLPGTTAPAQPKSTVLADLEKKVDETIKPQTVKVDEGLTLRYDEALQSQVAVAREYITGAANTAEHWAYTARDRLVTGERSVVRTIAGLKAADEDALPNTIYILVAGLTGSIIARPRTFVLRATLPWVFGIGAFAYLMPHTFQNTRDFVWKYEQEASPQLADAHTTAAKQLSDLKDQTVSAYETSEKSIASQVKSLRTQFKDLTGFDIFGKK